MVRDDLGPWGLFCSSRRLHTRLVSDWFLDQYTSYDLDQGLDCRGAVWGSPDQGHRRYEHPERCLRGVSTDRRWLSADPLRDVCGHVRSELALEPDSLSDLSGSVLRAFLPLPKNQGLGQAPAEKRGEDRLAHQRAPHGGLRCAALWS